MIELKVLHPDRWLICSARVEQAIRHGWADPSEPDSLTSLRLRTAGQLQRIELDLVPSTVRALAALDEGTVHVVVDAMGPAELDLEEALEALSDETGQDLAFWVWHESPTEVMAALASPEEAVVEAWKASRGMPRDFEIAGAWPEGWRDAYMRALQVWAAEASLQFPDETAGWLGLVAGGPREILANDAANDGTWTAVELGGLAAQTSVDPYAAMRRTPPEGSGERWALSRYPIVGQQAVVLMFEADPNSLARYVACTIQVLAEGRSYDLGQVDAAGVAELRIEGSVDIALATVRIFRPNTGA